MSSCLMVCSGSGGGHMPVNRLCERYVQSCDGKHHSRYCGVELLPCSYFASAGAGARDKGQKSKHRAEGRSCDRSFVFTSLHFRVR